MRTGALLNSLLLRSYDKLQKTIDMDSQLRPFQFLSLTFRALSHHLRTPLSIATNELSSLPPSDEVAHALAQLKSMSQRLKNLFPPGPSMLMLERCVLSSLEANDFEIATSSKDPMVLLDRARFEWVLRTIPQLLRATERPTSAIYSLNVSNDSATLTLNWGDSEKALMTPTLYSTFTDIFIASRDTPMIEPAVIDAILLGHNAETFIEDRGNAGLLRIILEAPR